MLYYLLSFMLVFSGCRTRPQKLKTQQTLDNKGSNNLFGNQDFNTKKVNISDLEITNLDLQEVDFRGNPMVQITITPPADLDYFLYKICPLETGEENCQEGSSQGDQILIPAIKEGTYRAFVRACVDPQRSTSSQEHCGTEINKLGQKTQTSDHPLDESLEKWVENSEEIKALGQELFDVISSYVANYRQCSQKEKLEKIFPLELATSYILQGPTEVKNRLLEPETNIYFDSTTGEFHVSKWPPISDESQEGGERSGEGSDSEGEGSDSEGEGSGKDNSNDDDDNVTAQVTAFFGSVAAVTTFLSDRIDNFEKTAITDIRSTLQKIAIIKESSISNKDMLIAQEENNLRNKVLNGDLLLEKYNEEPQRVLQELEKKDSRLSQEWISDIRKKWLLTSDVAMIKTQRVWSFLKDMKKINEDLLTQKSNKKLTKLLKEELDEIKTSIKTLTGEGPGGELIKSIERKVELAKEERGVSDPLLNINNEIFKDLQNKFNKEIAGLDPSKLNRGINYARKGLDFSIGKIKTGKSLLKKGGFRLGAIGTVFYAIQNKEGSLSDIAGEFLDDQAIGLVEQETIEIPSGAQKILAEIEQQGPNCQESVAKFRRLIDVENEIKDLHEKAQTYLDQITN